MKEQRPFSLWYYLAIAGFMTAAVALQVVRDRGWRPFEPPNSLLWVQSGDVAKRVALGFDNLVADSYWIRTVVYFGGRRAAATGNYDALYPLLQLTTDLDPRFKAAYRYGALFLAEPLPGGPGRPDQAIALLERAIARDGDWEYYQDTGFVYYWWLRDYPKAAEWFKRASEQPRAPSWLVGLAATTLAEGGNRESSRRLWTQVLEDEEAEYLHGSARHRLQQLATMDVIDALTPVLHRFVAREGGRLPKSWQELHQAERLPARPVDATGMPLIINIKTGRIDVSPKSTMWPLPLEPRTGPVR